MIERYANQHFFRGIGEKGAGKILFPLQPEKASAGGKAILPFF
jgi:hypothetical protein